PAGRHRPDADRLGVAGQEGRHRHRAEERHLQPHHQHRRRRGVAQDGQRLGHGRLRRLHQYGLPDHVRHLQHGRVVQRRGPGRRPKPPTDQRVGHPRPPPRRGERGPPPPPPAAPPASAPPPPPPPVGGPPPPP